MKVIIATNNKGKVSQFKKLFKELTPYAEFLTLSDINYTNDIEETGSTFEENSHLKAEMICKETGFAAIGEDSGICIDALNGEPGIYTARFEKNLTKQEKLQHVLDKLKNVPENERGAQFVSVITAVFPSGKVIQAKGICNGKITKEIINLEGGMAYTPIFIADGHTKALSELTEDELIAVNHRGIAAKEFVKQFKEYVLNETL